MLSWYYQFGDVEQKNFDIRCFKENIHPQIALFATKAASNKPSVRKKADEFFKQPIVLLSSIKQKRINSAVS